jgi:hypothetical protein
MMKPIKITKVIKMSGYEIRTEIYSGKEFGMDTDTEMDSAYTSSGDYIGNPEDAKYLVEKKGISPEKASPSHSVCSIGWSEKEQKYYGWSHRAIHGFGIGDIVKEGDITAEPGFTDEYLRAHPYADRSLPVGFIAKTKEDCKRMAIAFADSVA